MKEKMTCPNCENEMTCTDSLIYPNGDTKKYYKCKKCNTALFSILRPEEIIKIFIPYEKPEIINKEIIEATRQYAISVYGDSCILCGENRLVDVHHLIPRSKGGEDKIENLVVLCPTCHYSIHRNKISESEYLKLLKNQRKILYKILENR